MAIEARIRERHLLRACTHQITPYRYTFDLQTNALTPNLAPNPSAGAEHKFGAYRLRGVGTSTVEMSTKDMSVGEVEDDADD